MKKKKLWMLISDMTNRDVHFVKPSVSWMAKAAGVEFECYLESERNGSLFARTGSTVLGGHHHQQFNYLNAVYEVEYILFGESEVFTSSIEAFGAEILVQTASLIALYEVLLKQVTAIQPEAVGFLPC